MLSDRGQVWVPRILAFAVSFGVMFLVFAGSGARCHQSINWSQAVEIGARRLSWTGTRLELVFYFSMLGWFLWSEPIRLRSTRSVFIVTILICAFFGAAAFDFFVRLPCWSTAGP